MTIPNLQALQIEVSAVCNLRCTFCPTTYRPSTAKPPFFPLDVYRALVPYFPAADWVYLQGWGEPFLHRDLWAMVDLAREAGAKVGLTTNGTYFDDRNLARLFRDGVSALDLVSISIAGATPGTHGRLRVGSDLDAVFTAVRALVAARKRNRSRLPVIKFSYMLTKQSIPELPAAVAAAATLGVDELYATNLDYVFDRAADQNRVFAKGTEPAPDPAFFNYIAAAQKTARESNFPFRHYPLQVREQLASCELFPDDFIFITANGDVTPCTYLGRKDNPRYRRGETTNVPQKVFGNLKRATLGEIWSRAEYARFRAPFTARKRAYVAMTSDWRYYVSRFTRRTAERRFRAALRESPVPPGCGGCYKLYGA